MIYITCIYICAYRFQNSFFCTCHLTDKHFFIRTYTTKHIIYIHMHFLNDVTDAQYIHKENGPLLQYYYKRYMKFLNLFTNVSSKLNLQLM